MLLFWMEWIQNTKENPCLSLWDQGFSEAQHWCYLFDTSKQGHYFNLGKIQKSSDTPEKPMASGIYDSPALSAWNFLIPQSLSPRAAKNRCLHLDDPWGTDPILNPFYLGGGGKPKQKQTKSKPQKMSDLDLKMVQIHVLIICLLQLSSTVNVQRQPKSLL